MRIKKGDTVVIRAGKDRGKSGTVLRAFPSTDQVVVEGVNVQKRHRKTNKQTNQGGGIVEFAAPIHVSNVGIRDPKSGKATRVGRVTDGSKRVRVAKKSGTKLS